MVPIIWNGKSDVQEPIEIFQLGAKTWLVMTVGFGQDILQVFEISERNLLQICRKTNILTVISTITAHTTHTHTLKHTLTHTHINTI